jgi:flagellar biogenesis protein FliO
MDIFRQLLGAGAVFSLLAALVWWTRRTAGLRIPAWPSRSGGGKRLEAMERLSLTPQHSVHLVRFRDQYLLIGVHGAGFSLLRKFRGDSSNPLPGASLPKDTA